MKNLYSLLALCLVYCTALAQLDTVLFENFQTNPFGTMDTSATGSNTNWVNFDADGLTTAFQTEESKKWYWDDFFVNPVDPNTGVTNYIATSLSFLQGALPGNRNWMILPPIEITDDNYMLHWESAPAQMPRYMDGYAVLVSAGSNDTNGNSFTDTLFLAASMDEITGNGQSTDYSNFTFTPGYLHADGGMDATYFFDNGGGTILNGLLEPNSVSLEAYEGQTIYIAFLHNSDDDERIGLDDILITKTATSNTNETALQEMRMECYPNPADHRMNLNFQLKTQLPVGFQIMNASGQLVYQQNLGELPEGSHQVKLLLSQFVLGAYFLRLQAGEMVATQTFVKK